MEPTTLDNPRLKLIYEMSADRYLRSLPLEHFMEATPQATQREITLESFALIRAMRPDVQCFNELLLQYPRQGTDPDTPDQVVPDNMIVVHREPIVAEGSYNLPLQPVGPLMVLEYVSKRSRRKDYDANMLKYEQHVKVPYYLLFYPDADELSLFRLGKNGYVAVHPSEAGRVAIPELELEAGLHEGWVRFWFRGELLPLPGDLLRQLIAARDQLEATSKARAFEREGRLAAEQRAESEHQARLTAEAEVARLRAELAKRPPTG